MNAGSVEQREINLFGMIWDRNEDQFKTTKLYLSHIVITKRELLSTIHSNFDHLGTCLPVLNRARLFLHTLQSYSQIDCDDEFCSERRNEWKKISVQINKSENDFSIPQV